jgi:hypothetical protein
MAARSIYNTVRLRANTFRQDMYAQGRRRGHYFGCHHCEYVRPWSAAHKHSLLRCRLQKRAYIGMLLQILDELTQSRLRTHRVLSLFAAVLCVRVTNLQTLCCTLGHGKKAAVYAVR